MNTLIRFPTAMVGALLVFATGACGARPSSENGRSQAEAEEGQEAGADAAGDAAPSHYCSSYTTVTNSTCVWAEYQFAPRWRLVCDSSGGMEGPRQCGVGDSWAEARGNTPPCAGTGNPCENLEEGDSCTCIPGSSSLSSTSPVVCDDNNECVTAE